VAYEQLKNSTLPKILSEVVAGLADLFQKELRLAKAEISEKLSLKLQAGVWMIVAGLLGFIAGLLIIEGAIFGIASFGLPLHWSCLLVAAVLAAFGGLAFMKGRSDAKENFIPNRTINQIKQDITTAKERLT
jgi:hypothetical protein